MKTLTLTTDQSQLLDEFLAVQEKKRAAKRKADKLETQAKAQRMLLLAICGMHPACRLKLADGRIVEFRQTAKTTPAQPARSYLLYEFLEV